ncbi:MAG TPA: LicD family protein [Verrucomicrobiae bacterium]|nr:LicD family protein [Verrucomicrobiae bacterium]
MRKLSKRSKSLLAHGSSVLEQALRACREAGVRPHLNFGTLLGYRRNKGFIQGDDDLDFGLLASDRPDIPLLIKTMEKAGFRLKAEHHLEGPLAAIGDYCEITFVHQETGVSTDFYFYHAWNQEILYAGAAELIGHFHEGLLKFTPVEKNKIAGYALSYPGDLAGKFVPAPFLSSEILVPADTDAYLERLYGNWKIPQKNFYYKNVSAIVSSASSTGIELVRLPAPAETAS